MTGRRLLALISAITLIHSAAFAGDKKMKDGDPVNHGIDLVRAQSDAIDAMKKLFGDQVFALEGVTPADQECFTRIETKDGALIVSGQDSGPEDGKGGFDIRPITLAPGADLQIVKVKSDKKKVEFKIEPKDAKAKHMDMEIRISLDQEGKANGVELKGHKTRFSCGTQGWATRMDPNKLTDAMIMKRDSGRSNTTSASEAAKSSAGDTQGSGGTTGGGSQGAH